RADSRPVMDQLWNKSRAARRFGIANGVIDIQDWGVVIAWVTVAIRFRPVASSGNDVLNAVPIDITDGQRMHLGEGHTARIGSRVVVHDHVPLERNVPLCISLLPVPSQSPGVRRQGSYHVIQAVAVHIVSIHLSSADESHWTVFAPESDRVICPELLTASIRRPLPPSSRIENGLRSVSSDVSHS